MFYMSGSGEWMWRANDWFLCELIGRMDAENG